MKIRNGYVSNSSSSSFCIVGVIFDEEKFGMDYEAFEKKLYENCSYDRNGLISENGIAVYYDEYIIGFDINAMKEDETLRDYKKRIFEALKKVGFNGNEDEIKIRIDGGYEG